MMTAMSELKSRLQSDLTAAMKAREELVVSTLRLVLSAVTTAEVAGDTAVELSDEQVMATLRSEAKKRAEAADGLRQVSGRQLAARRQRGERGHQQNRDEVLDHQHADHQLAQAALDAVLFERLRDDGGARDGDDGAGEDGLGRRPAEQLSLIHI